MKTFSLALVLAAGCATDGAAVDPGADNGKADGQLVTVTFADDFSETADGPLVAGSQVRIRYDLDRATQCRGFTNGSDAWGVAGFASFDGAEAKVFEVSRIVDGETRSVDAELAIPHGAKSVAIWFENNDVFGCHAFDSNEGANYQFAIDANDDVAVLGFEADFSETQSGDVKAGGRVVLHYDPVRLEECAASSGGMAKWSVTAHYQIDGGATKSTLVTRADGPDAVAADPTIAIPAGRELAVWFEAVSTFGCHAFDSNLNANYRYAIR